jgi:hypothetical protein
VTQGRIYKLPPFETNVREALGDALKQADDLQGVVILGLKRDTSQVMFTSKFSVMGKALLLAFFQAWMTKWFHFEEGP